MCNVILCQDTLQDRFTSLVKTAFQDSSFNIFVEQWLNDTNLILYIWQKEVDRTWVIIIFPLCMYCIKNDNSWLLWDETAWHVSWHQISLLWDETAWHVSWQLIIMGWDYLAFPLTLAVFEMKLTERGRKFESFCFSSNFNAVFTKCSW